MTEDNPPIIPPPSTPSRTPRSGAARSLLVPKTRQREANRKPTQASRSSLSPLVHPLSDWQALVDKELPATRPEARPHRATFLAAVHDAIKIALDQGERVPHWAARYLLYLSEAGQHTRAAFASGTTPQTVSAYLESWDWLKETAQQALKVAAEAVESTVRGRALDGWERPVFYQGQQVGAERLYSDKLAEVLLRGLYPERYPERGSGTGGGGPLVVIQVQDSK